MNATFNTLNASANLLVLGETLRPLLTHAMGSSIEIFDTTGPVNSGPPTHFHPWEEIYVVLNGELEVIVEGRSETIAKGAVAHIPANTRHGYRNASDDCHCLTIVTQGNAAQFFAEAASDVQMSPPDIPAIVRVAKTHGIEFVL